MNLPGLDELEGFNDTKPTQAEFILYLFWEKGISYEVFSRLPIPYILSVVNTHNYVKEMEYKEMKKSQRK